MSPSSRVLPLSSSDTRLCGSGQASQKGVRCSCPFTFSYPGTGRFPTCDLDFFRTPFIRERFMRKHAMVCSIQLALLSMAAPALAQSASEPQQLDTVQVTGSRIPRAQVEGPAPVTVVSAEQIKAAGLTSVPEVLRSLSQNSGSVQGQQNTTGAQSTPGAQAVDLRGLGPNHTLVLINGRRIADFPLPLNGRSNFTDIGNIPLGMIDRKSG